MTSCARTKGGLVRSGAVRLKHDLGQVQADDANLSHGRPPSRQRLNACRYGPADAAGGGASAPSLALVLHGSPLGFRNVVRGANGAVYDIVF
jgi:hypothetical protein